MSTDVVIGTASGILQPFLELLMNPDILGIIALIYFLMKFESWINRKAVLGKYEQEFLLDKEISDMKKKINKGDWKKDIDFDKLAKKILSENGGETNLSSIVDDIKKYNWKDWL